MKSAGKARNNGLYRHIRTSKEIIRNLLNDWHKNKKNHCRRYDTNRCSSLTIVLLSIRILYFDSIIIRIRGFLHPRNQSYQ